MTATRGASAVQAVPWDTVDLLRPFFDHGPLPMGARLLDLPVGRGLWVAAVGSAGAWIDSSGHGHTLTLNGDPEFDYDGLVPFFDYDGAGDYHSRTDEPDNSITGTETYVASTKRGLTAYCWCYPEETGTLEYIFSKWPLVGNRSWALRFLVGDLFSMVFSDDGTNVDAATSLVVSSVNAWYFLCGRVRPGAFVDLFVGSSTGLEETNQATARASVFDGNGDLVIGARHGGADAFNGRVAVAALYASAHSDTQIKVFYHMTKRYFGY